MPSSSDDELAIARLCSNWGLWRDTRRWDALRTAYTDDARMTTTWFDGPAIDFIEASRAAAGRSALVLHAMVPTHATVRGDRAVSETRLTLLVRDRLEGIEVDVTCYGRFVDRLLRQDGRWRIRSRMPIYEKDSLALVHPGPAPQLDEAALADFPIGYRHLAYVQSRGGAQIVRTIPGHNSEAQQRLYDEHDTWLHGGA